MEYQAERTNDGGGIFNYFSSHQMGPEVTRLGEDVWQALINSPSHSVGYMVQNPVPNDQYFYERMNWVATARISIDPTGNSSAQVARIEIANGGNILSQRVITEGEFGGSTAFRTFEVAYSLPPPSPKPGNFKIPVASTLSAQDQPNIDVRVWWYDQVNTYLDFIVLEDSVMHPDYSGAYQLFRGLRDKDITVRKVL
jgi:hypothetical protein